MADHHDHQFEREVLHRLDHLHTLVHTIKNRQEEDRTVLRGIETDVAALVANLHRVTGIVVTPGQPVDRPSVSVESCPLFKEPTMANKAKVTLVKKPAMKAMATRGAHAAGDAVLFQDNQDDTLTVQGVDAAGSPVDIAAVATLTVTSDNPAVVSVDAPAGMLVTFHGLAVGSANLLITATWNDGSMGPFNFSQPCSVAGGPATGLTVTLGTPTTRP